MKLIFSGDLCLAGSIKPVLSDDINKLLKSADLVCFNFEAPFIDIHANSVLKAGPSIYQNNLALDLIKDCYTTHVNLANNHIMDYGIAGLRTTLSKFESIKTIGAGLSYSCVYAPEYFVHDHQRIALLAFGEAQFGVLQTPFLEQAGFAWVDSPDARKSVLEASHKADWVIVQVHGGLEMVDIPLPEWRVRYREFIDLGADIVIGHHPHVLQGSECYKGKMIYYSLGNFYMDIMLRQVDPGSGGLLEVIIEDGQISSRLIPLLVTRETIDLNDSDAARDNYQSICNKLNDDSAYLKEIEIICEDFWTNVYSKYYESALSGLGTKPNKTASFELIRKLLAFIVRRRWNEKSNELMLIHNIRIETHRWVVERALLKRALQ